MPTPRGPEKTARERVRMRKMAADVQQMATTDEFLDAIEGAREDSGEFGRLKANPRSYFRGKGIDIPRDVEVEFTEESSWMVCFYYYYWYYRVRYCYYVS